MYPTVQIGGPRDEGVPVHDLTVSEMWNFLGTLFAVGGLEWARTGDTAILGGAVLVTLVVCAANYRGEPKQ